MSTMTDSGQGSADLPGIPYVVPSRLFDDEAVEDRWLARVRTAKMTLPTYARKLPAHSVYRSNATGTFEIYAWDRASDTHRQVTDRPGGTLEGAIDPDGEKIWWFADTDGDELGHWMVQPFPAKDAELGSAEPALKGAPDGYAQGLVVGSRVAVAGLADDDGFAVWISRDGGPAEQIYRHNDGHVAALSTDEQLVAMMHAEHGDSLNCGVRVLRTADGSSAGERRDEGRPLIPLDWAPAEGDHRLLVTHERGATTGLLIWDLDSDQETLLDIPLPGELAGCWYPDGSALLVRHTHAGRNTLHRYQLDTGTLTALPVAPGCITETDIRPDGTVEYLWSSAAQPWTIRCCTTRGEDHELLTPSITPAPPSVPIRDVWIDGPGGRVHAFISRPAAAQGPGPTVFRLHGGPHEADEDSYNAMRAAWVDAGYTVVQPNFRGSTGYGPEWRNGIIGRPGLTELEDVAAVQQWCIANGISDPARCVVEGYSWGGYLVLLAAGTQPDRWAAAVAGLPIADYEAAYADEMEPLKATDRSLFGGNPTQFPERYKASSPITYVAQVKTPVLILAAANDARCPIRQINNYAAALDEVDQSVHILRYDAGHSPSMTAMVEAFTSSAISFVRRCC